MTEKERLNQLTERIIGAAISVHCALGPGLLESSYETCLAFELGEQGLNVERQKPLPVISLGLLLNFNETVLKNGITRVVNNFGDCAKIEK